MPWAPDYCDADQLMDYARTDAVDVNEVDVARSTASRAVDGTCHRQFGRVDAPQARVYSARWSRTHCGWVVETADLMTLTGLAVAYDPLFDGSYSLTVDPALVRWLPFDAAERQRPWERALLRPAAGTFSLVRGAFRFTAQWGWTPNTAPGAVSPYPLGVHQASLLQGSRLLMRRDSPYGIAGSPDAGSEKRLLAKVDPDVEVALKQGGYVRRTWAR